MMLICVKILFRWDYYSSIGRERSLSKVIYWYSAGESVLRQRLLLKLIVHSFGQLVSTCLVSCSSFRSCRGINTLSVALDSTSCSWLLISSTDRRARSTSQVFNDFLFCVTQIALPDHDNLVSSSAGKVISTRTEVNTSWGTFMPVKSIKNMSLSQVPNL